LPLGSVGDVGHRSRDEFRTLHALRIKGFASVDVLTGMTALDSGAVEAHLGDFRAGGHVRFREARSLWQLTPEGRETHTAHLDQDLHEAPTEPLSVHYATFIEQNVAFKELCGLWQLRDGEPNDHSDSGYDAEVIDRLDDLHGRARPIVGGFGSLFERMHPYSGRLDDVLGRLRDGDTQMFTGVMCGSYHDVWMELHEDLIITQRIDRAAEGSF
jgi:hypothetical protein